VCELLNPYCDNKTIGNRAEIHKNKTVHYNLAKNKSWQCDWSAKKFAAKKLDSSYFFTVRATFLTTRTPTGNQSNRYRWRMMATAVLV
jgi:hypothetical protein